MKTDPVDGKPQSAEIKLTTNFWIRTASVWYVVAVKRHHVTEHICLSITICKWKNKREIEKAKLFQFSS